MATHDVVADIMLEDKIANLWPDYPCLYDVKSPDFKNRDLRERSFQDIAEKVGESGKCLDINTTNKDKGNLATNQRFYPLT